MANAGEFTVATLAVPRGGVRAVRDELGAAVWGVFAPQIGAASDALEVVVPGELPALSSATVSSTAALAATVRPTSADALPADDGVYAHRWFDIDPSDWDEFLALSEGAWPGFEGVNPGVRIHGFFRAGADGERVLLVTRYPSLAAWETSRNVDDDGGRANFVRRHQLTRSTIVRTYRLIA